MRTFLFSLMILVLAVGCSNEPKKEKADALVAQNVSQEAHMVANENQAPFVTEVAFNKGSSSLTKFSKQQIQQIVTKAQNSGEIKEVKVITWADQEYPSVHAKALPKSQVDLVKKRNQEIKKYIEDTQDSLKVELYSMAERPGAWADLLSTSNARIKESLEVAGIPNTDTAVKTPAKAQKSIIMLILK